jgi:hypothetical protein
MAAYSKFNNFVEDLCKGVHDFQAAGNVFKIYLANTTPSASLDLIKTDLAEIGTGNGYTAGGEDVQNTLAEAAGTATVSGTKVVWTASGGSIGPFQYVVLYNDTSTTPADPLVAWWDYGTALTLLDTETFSVKFNASETSGSIFTLA